MGLETVSLPCMADLEAQLAGLRCAWNSLTSPEAPAPGAQRHAKNAGRCSPGRPSPQPPGPRVGTELLPEGCQQQQQQQPLKRRMHDEASGHFSGRAQQAGAEVTERAGPLPSSGYPDLASAAWQEVVQAAQQPRRQGQGQQAEAAWARPDVQGAQAASRHTAGETSQAGSRSLCAGSGAGDSGASLRASHAAARLAALRQAQTSRRAVPPMQQPAAEQCKQRHGREARPEGSQQRQGLMPQRRQTWSGSSGRHSPEQASLGAHPAAAGVQGTAPTDGQACEQQRRQHGGTGQEQESEDAGNLWRDWLRASHDVGPQAAAGRQKRRARRPQWHIDPALPPVIAGEGDAPQQAAAEPAAQPALPSLHAPPAARDTLGYAAAGPAAPSVLPGSQGHRDLQCHPAAPSLARPSGQHSCPSIGAPAHSPGAQAQDIYSGMQQSGLPQLPPTFGAGSPGSTPRPCQQLPGQYMRHPHGPGAAAGRHLLPRSGRVPLQALPWQNGSRPGSQEQRQQAASARAAHESPSCDARWHGSGHQLAALAQPADWGARQEASLGHAGPQPRRHSEGSWQTHHHQPKGEPDHEQHSRQDWQVQLAAGRQPFGQHAQAAAGGCAVVQHQNPLHSGASLWPQGADANSQQQNATAQQAHVGAPQEPASGLAACLAAALAHMCRDIPLVEDQEHVDARMQQVRQRLHVSAAATPGQQEEAFTSPQGGQRRSNGRRPVGDGGFEGLSLGEVLANPPRSRQQAPGLASGSGTDEEAQPEQPTQSPPAVDPWNGLGLGEVLQPRRQSVTDGGNRPRVGRRPPASASPSYADFVSDLQAAGVHSRNRLAVHLGRPARNPAGGSPAARSFGERRSGTQPPAGQQHQGPAEASAAAVHPAGLEHQVDSQGFPIIDAAQLEQLLGSAAPDVPNMQRRQQARAALSLLERFQFAAPARHRSAAAAEDAQDCSICLDTFCNKQFLRRFIGCKHAFHDKCISEWMATGDVRCPLCRWDPIKCAWPDED